MEKVCRNDKRFLTRSATMNLQRMITHSTENNTTPLENIFNLCIQSRPCPESPCGMTSDFYTQRKNHKNDCCWLKLFFVVQMETGRGMSRVSWVGFFTFMTHTFTHAVSHLLTLFHFNLTPINYLSSVHKYYFMWQNFSSFLLQLVVVVVENLHICMSEFAMVKSRHLACTVLCLLHRLTFMAKSSILYVIKILPIASQSRRLIICKSWPEEKLLQQQERSHHHGQTVHLDMGGHCTYIDLLGIHLALQRIRNSQRLFAFCIW